MPEKIYHYDPVEALDSEEAILTFMEDAFETCDPIYIAKALGVVARAKGMSDISRKTGLSREQLYRSFSMKGNPTLKTMLTVMQALGMDMTVKLAIKQKKNNSSHPTRASQLEARHRAFPDTRGVKHHKTG